MNVFICYFGFLCDLSYTLNLFTYQDAAIVLSVMCGNRASDDATMQASDETNYHRKLRGVEKLDSKPFAGDLVFDV